MFNHNQQAVYQYGTINNDDHLENNPVEAELHLLSLHQAINFFADSSFGFVKMRLILSLQDILSSIYVNFSLGANTKDQSDIFMTQKFAIGFSRGALTSINIVINQLHSNGRGPNQYLIGPTMNQAIVLACLLGMLTMIFFLTAKSWLPIMGVDNLIATQSAEYLFALAWSILPMYGFTIFQNFFLSLRRKEEGNMINYVFLLSWLFSLGVLHLIQKSLTILGSSMVCASLATCSYIAYHFFYTRKGQEDQDTYRLFIYNFDGGATSCEIFCRSIPGAVQSISEWFPGLMMALINSDKENSKTLGATVAASLISLVFCSMLLGMCTAVSNFVSSHRQDYLNERIDLAKRKRNAINMLLATSIITTLYLCIALIPCIFFPALFIKLTSNPEDSDMFCLAKDMLRLTFPMLLLDGSRNVITGFLTSKIEPMDIYVTSLLNLGMNVIIFYGYAAQKKSYDPVEILTQRTIGIFITTLLLFIYWLERNQITEIYPTCRAVVSNCYSKLNFFVQPVDEDVENHNSNSFT